MKKKGFTQHQFAPFLGIPRDVWKFRKIIPKCANRKATGAGFTLIEILVAGTLIALLASIGIVSYTSVTKRSRDSKRKSDVEQLRTALEMYRADYSSYPPVNTVGYDTVDNLKPYLVDAPYNYVPAIPRDPSVGYRYSYKATNASGGSYFGYCVSAYVESEDPSDTCTSAPATDTGEVPIHNYGVKNP